MGTLEPFLFHGSRRCGQAGFTGLAQRVLSAHQDVQPSVHGHYGRDDCRTAKAGTLPASAGCSSGRTRRRESWTSSILRCCANVDDVGTPIDDLQWSAVLRSVSGFEMYRKRHHGITPKRVAGFLILDRFFPGRSCIASMPRTSRCTRSRARPRALSGMSAEKRLGQLRGELAYADIDEIVTSGAARVSRCACSSN